MFCEKQIEKYLKRFNTRYSYFSFDKVYFFVLPGSCLTIILN